MPRSRAPRPPPLCRKSCTSSTGLRLIQVRQNSTEGISWKFSPSSSAGVFGFSWTTGSSAIPVPVSRCPRSSAAAAYVRPAGRRRRAPRTPQSLDNPTGWRASNIWWPTCPGQVAVLLVLTQVPLSLFIRKSRAVTDSQSIGESIQVSGSSGSAFCRGGVRSPLRPRPRSDVSPQLQFSNQLYNWLEILSPAVALVFCERHYTWRTWWGGRGREGEEGIARLEVRQEGQVA